MNEEQYKYALLERELMGTQMTVINYRIRDISNKIAEYEQSKKAEQDKKTEQSKKTDK